MSETQPRKIIELEKFMMFAPAPNAEGRRSKLAWGIRDGNPRIVVYTNDPSDKEQRGMIFARMDPTTFFAFLEEFEGVCRSPNESRGWVECWTGEYQNDKPTGQKIKDSTLYYGKNAEGVVWLMVDSAIENRPKVRFVFEISDYHAFYKPDGTQMSRGEASTRAAIATVRNIRQVFSNLLTDALKLLSEEKAAKRLTADPTKPRGGSYPNKPKTTDKTTFDDFTF